MTPKTIDRRKFLRGLGASTAALPFFPAHLASAADAAPPKRVVFWWTAQGIFHPEFTPDGGDTAFTLKRVLEPLAKYKDRMLLPKRLDFGAYFAKPINNDHEPAVFALTGAELDGDGYSLGPSIDQYLAQRLNRPGLQDGLVLGVESYWAEMRKTFWRKARESVTGENSSSTAFNRLFGAAAAPAAPGAPDAAAVLRAERKSVIDNVRVELEALRKRLAAEDRPKIEAHLDFIRAQELRLVAAPPSPTGAACGGTTPVAPAGLTGMPAQGQKQIMNLIAALRCDLARVASLAWSAPGGAGNIVYSWLPGVTGRHHDLSHSGRPKAGESTYEQLTAIGRWHATQLASFLDRLAEVKEGAGTMLDNTVVVWTSEHAGNKPGEDDHSRRDVPYLLIGSCGGHFRTGQVLDFNGRSNNDLFVSLCHAMGFEDVKTFGNPAVCKGPLPGLRRA